MQAIYNTRKLLHQKPNSSLDRRGEDRKGEEKMKVSTTTTCHRQTDDTSTGLCAGDLAVITPHTHKHKSMHAHTLLTG